MSELDFDSIIASGVLKLPEWDSYNSRIATGYNLQTKQNEPVYIEIVINKYKCNIQSIDDFKREILEKNEITTIKEAEQLKEDIDEALQANQQIEHIRSLNHNMKMHVKNTMKEYSEYLFDKYDDISFKVQKYIIDSNNKSNKFIKLNKDAIFKAIDDIRLLTIEKIKQNKKIANKKYYENRRIELGLEKKEPLTEEQKKERQRLAKEKFNEKQKELKQPKQLLTEEEKEEKKKLANQKYYQKKKQELGIDFDKEETEEQMKRKKYNETYYNKQKEMRNKVKELESKLAELTR